MIPLVDLKVEHASLRAEIEAAVREVLGTGQYVMGPNVAAFEREAAEYLGVRHALGVASGTDALLLALRAAGVGPGDEVLTTAFTFVAAVESIVHAGARPVFVDIERASFNMDPAAIEAALTPSTRAIVPVHLFGRPAEMDVIMDIAARHRLVVIEDCAQSFGARAARGMTGAIGLAGCFSFYPSKNLGCAGDGGLITTDSDAIAARVRSLRNHGSSERYHHPELGYNSRLDEIQAAILRAKLPHVEARNEARRRVARTYSRQLAELPVATPAEPGRGTHVFHQYTILSPHRDAIMRRLAADGIAAAIYYPVPLHRQPFSLESGKRPSLPVTERVARECLSLPMYPELTERQVVEVAASVAAALADSP